MPPPFVYKVIIINLTAHTNLYTYIVYKYISTLYTYIVVRIVSKKNESGGAVLGECRDFLADANQFRVYIPIQ